MARKTRTVAEQRNYSVLDVRSAKRVCLVWLERAQLQKVVGFGLPEVDDRYHIWRVPLLNKGNKERIGEVVIDARTSLILEDKSTAPEILEARRLGRNGDEVRPSTSRANNRYPLIDWNIRAHPKPELVKASRIGDDYERTNVWRIKPAHDKRHPAIFPVELAEKVVTYYSFQGDVVLDPFAGIGTVGEAAAKLGRRFVLIEQDPKYVAIIRAEAKRWLGEDAQHVLTLNCPPIEVTPSTRIWGVERHVEDRRGEQGRGQLALDDVPAQHHRSANIGYSRLRKVRVWQTV